MTVKSSFPADDDTRSYGAIPAQFICFVSKLVSNERESYTEFNIASENCDDGNATNNLFGLDDNSSSREQLSVILNQSYPVIVSFFLEIGGTFIILFFAGNFTYENCDQRVILAAISLTNVSHLL